MRTVQIGPLTGLLGQLVLLCALAATLGLGGAGWSVGIACGLATNATLALGLLHRGAGGLGPADRVTLARTVLAGGVAAMVADSFHRPVDRPALVSLAVLALALDAVDGWVARRTATSTPLGARFDMEVDALLILVLSVLVSRTAGGWVLAIGAARYVMFAAGRVLPWLRGAIPPRYWCKVVAAIQGIVLTFAAADVAPRTVTGVVLALSLALLAESFGREVGWLWRHRSAEPGHAVPLAHPPAVAPAVRALAHAGAP